MSGSPEAPPPRSAVPPEETEGPVVTRPPAPPPPPFPIPPLFGKYSFEGLEVHDPGLAPYLYLHPIYAPHTEGKLSGHPFQKTRMHLVERLTNHLMKGEHFTGKKSKALATVRKAFDELSRREKQNPLQLLINAVENAAPREEVTRLQFGGISVPRAVDAAPSRRVGVAIRNIAQGAIQASHKSTKSIETCLANEIALAAKGDQTSFAVARKEEVERVAQSAR
ncbi:MAG: 30S ribosomal protein S7 [Candidatus Thermoplasmatota archaeon]|jgi:small subunit ribosomal protein S7|nr:30S ribosomal protein S7 [Candidatus Thermoplasmatota archaeon]MCL5983577.1 30S ribosomal protein S7 [Candidatus Thermoplasmatota archaeon]